MTSRPRLAVSLVGLVSIFLVAPALGLVSAGCSKDEPPASPAPAPPASPSIPVAAVSASALPSAAPLPSAAASVVASASASGAPSSSSSAKPGATCGDKPLPPCPLAAWMKSNTSPAMTAQDFGALATALEKIVSFAPAGYTNWVSICHDGADAARAQSLDGVKAACRGCHNQYKEKYRREMRDRPI